LKPAAIWLTLLIAGVVHAESGWLPVWDVETPVGNALGGSYNGYGSAGCDIVAQRTPLVHRGPTGHSLKITYHNSNAPSCGIWMHLFHDGAAAGPVLPDSLPDTTRFPFLSFWIREGGKAEDMEVRMADAEWLARDDSKVAGRASRYLSGSPEDGWREVVVPVRDFQLPGSRAAVVAWQFAPQTSGVLYIDDIGFKRAPGLQTAFNAAPASSSGAARRRAMWLWETTQLLEQTSRQSAALGTLQQARVTDLFLQIPRAKHSNDNTKIELQPELRRFLRMAHAHALQVHALDGFPEFSLREHHATVLALVQNVLNFNLSGAPEERFDGIHLDDEPYQLLGFEGPSRAEIFQEYLELNQKVAALLHSQPRPLAFGVDIPFWWDSVSTPEHPCCLVKFNGVSQSAARQIIDLTDNVGIMAYRNFAGGMDGIVNHARGNLEYAGERGKQAFVAVETYRSPPLPVTFVAAIQESRWQALPADAGLLRASQLQGYPLRAFTDGQYRYVGLADKKGESTTQPAYADAVRLLQRSLPGQPADWTSDLRAFPASVERYGHTSGEWQSVSVVPLALPNTPGGGFGLSVTEDMPAKITLAGKTRAFVDEILEEVAEAFDHQPGFTGDAIHSLESYQQLK
jgi:hypothetical protein